MQTYTPQSCDPWNTTYKQVSLHMKRFLKGYKP